jgi:hypothetical protein
MEKFKYLGTNVTNEKSHTQKKIKGTINFKKIWYHVKQNLVSPHYPKNTKDKYEQI